VRIMLAEHQGDAGTLLALVLSAAERELVDLDIEVTR